MYEIHFFHKNVVQHTIDTRTAVLFEICDNLEYYNQSYQTHFFIKPLHGLHSTYMPVYMGHVYSSF
jgi:hypothetical protein